jgi:hypothetical protein
MYAKSISHPAIGNIIATGRTAARWMYVTRVTQSTDGSGALVYWGRLWDARKKQWNKRSSGCAREAINVGTPSARCPRKPRGPGSDL